MIKTKIIILAGFLVAFGAGIVVGMLVQRTAENSPDHRPSLVKELGLDSKQAEQMKQIWPAAIHASDRAQEEGRKALSKERDAAIASLLNPEQKAAYEKIQRDYVTKLATLAEQRSKAIQAAVEQTKKILTESQRIKYEQLLKKWEGDRRGHGRRFDDRGTSRPATN